MIGKVLAAGLVTMGWVGLSATAMADTFSESVQFGSGPTDFNNSPGTTASPGGNALFYFDSNGGTLNSVTVSYSYSVSSQISLTNTSQYASNGRVRVQSGAQFTSNDAMLTNALKNIVDNYIDPVDGTAVQFGNSQLTPIAADVRGTISSYSLNPGSSNSVGSTGSYTSAAYTVTDLDDLAAFSRAGGGSFTPLFSTLTGLQVQNSGGNTTATQVATAQGNLSISFNYSAAAPAAVPEPASLVLLGAGLLGLLVARRRIS